MNQANNINKQCNQIRIITLELEQKLQISNNEKNQATILLKVQIAKSNC